MQAIIFAKEGENMFAKNKNINNETTMRVLAKPPINGMRVARAQQQRAAWDTQSAKKYDGYERGTP